MQKKRTSFAESVLFAIREGEVKVFDGKDGYYCFHAGTALKNTPSVALLKSLGFELTSTEQISFFKDDAGNNIYFEGGNFTKNLGFRE